MKTAYVTSIWGNNYHPFLLMIKILRLSLLSLGSKNDFIILAAGIPDLEVDFDAEIRHVPLISNKQKPWRKYMSKVHMWNFTDYDRIFHMEADCVARRNPEKDEEANGEFIYVNGTQSPLNAARFIIKPSRAVFEDLHRLATDYPFDPDTGWEECGPFVDACWKDGKRSKWTFYAADDEQGLFYYYFCVKRGIGRCDFGPISSIMHKSPKTNHSFWVEMAQKYGLEDEVEILKPGQ